MLFGGSLTEVAVLPPGSQRDLVDPFAEKWKTWGLQATIIVILLLAGYGYFGKLDNVLPDTIKSTTVLGTNAPASGRHSPADSGVTNTKATATGSLAK
ncbi:MAG: hypothetical protein ABSA45_00125 [Verrucomicrobiota bacterium]